LLDEIIITNVLVFLLVMARAGSGRTVFLRVGVIAWVVTNIVLFYALVLQNGGASPVFTFYVLRVPWYGLAGLALALVLLPIGRDGTKSLRLPAILIAVMGAAYTHNLAVINPLLNRAGSSMEQVLGTFSLVMPFAICVLCLLPWFAMDGTKALRQVFLPVGQDIATHKGLLLGGLAAFAVVFLVSNLVIFGKLIEVYIVTSPRVFFLLAVVTCFYWVLFEHFVAIGICRRVIQKLFPDQKPSGFEVFFFAVLLASMYYNTEIKFMVREFFYGLIFGYLYLRTGTLFYGIVMRSMAAFFVA